MRRAGIRAHGVQLQLMCEQLQLVLALLQAGVTKLMGIKDALQRCPSLVLVR